MAAAGGAAACLGAACAWLPSSPPLEPVALTRLREGSPPPPGDNWPLGPERIEALLQSGHAEIVSLEPLSTGVTRPYKALVRFPDEELTLPFKWKPSTPDLDHWNNSPRKELAAYAIQKWFLDPEDYVVPTVELVCVPLEGYRKHVPDATPTVPGTSCVLGLFAIWLEGVGTPDTLYDADRFRTDPTYATHLGRLNLLMYLIGHRDGRGANVLASDDDANRRVFSVDNGIAFDPPLFNWFYSHWDRIRVPALPERAVRRLADLDDDRIESLEVVAELHADDSGVLRPVLPGEAWDDDLAVDVRPGALQLGLTEREAEALEDRVEWLTERAEDGDLALF